MVLLHLCLYSSNKKTSVPETYPNVSYEIHNQALPSPKIRELHYPMPMFMLPVDCVTNLKCLYESTLRSDCQGLTLTPLLSPTIDTTYSNGVLIACLKPCQFTLCDTGSSDVQESSIWGIRIVGVNADEVGIGTVSTTQRPAHSDIHSSIGILREVNTGEGGTRWGTWRSDVHELHSDVKNTIQLCIRVLAAVE